MHHGLRCSKSQGRLKAVWLATKEKSSWAALRVVERHGGRIEAVVTLDARTIATVGAGDSFGEIALLRDVPRTATVTARTDLRLLALDSDEFVAAVTRYPETAEAADAVVAARLSRLGAVA